MPLIKTTVRRTTALLLVSLTSIVLSACVDWAPYAPIKLGIERDPDKVYAAAVRVFLRKGWGFQQRDPAARAVETTWITYSSIGSNPYFSHRILISKASFELFTSCLKDDPVLGSLATKCPENERPRQLPAIERELMDEILKEADTL